MCSCQHVIDTGYKIQTDVGEYDRMEASKPMTGMAVVCLETTGLCPANGWAPQQ
jgi:hypothetical protein